MSKEYERDNRDIWWSERRYICEFERFTDSDLAHRLMKTHYSKNITICYGTENKYDTNELKSWEYLDGTLLNKIKNSTKIIEDDIIKIIEKER